MFSHESSQKADLASTIFQRILENVFPNVKASRKKGVGVRRERENINFLFRLVSHSQGASYCICEYSKLQEKNLKPATFLALCISDGSILGWLGAHWG